MNDTMTIPKKTLLVMALLIPVINAALLITVFTYKWLYNSKKVNIKLVSWKAGEEVLPW